MSQINLDPGEVDRKAEELFNVSLGRSRSAECKPERVPFSLLTVGERYYWRRKAERELKYTPGDVH